MREENHGKDAQTEATDPLNKAGTQANKNHKKHMYATHKSTPLREYITAYARTQDNIFPGILHFVMIAFQKPWCYTLYKKSREKGVYAQCQNINILH